MNLQDYVKENKDKLDARELALVQTELNAGRMCSWVSQEQEASLYHWYLLGRSLKDISGMSNLPEVVIVLTALRYDWKARRDTILTSGDAPTKQLEKDTLNSIFGLIMQSVQLDVKEVMAGTKDPRNSIYIPKNATQLKDFLEVLQQANGAQAPPEQAPPQVIVVPMQQIESPRNVTPSKLSILQSLAGETIDEK